MQKRSLPDVYSFAFRAIHLVAFLDSERVEELLEVTQGNIDPVHCERVYVEFGQACLFCVADVLCPYCRVCEAESVQGG